MTGLKKSLIGIMLMAAGLLVGCGKSGNEIITFAYEPPAELVTQSTAEALKENTIKIGIIQSNPDASMTEIYEGFMEEMENSGYLDANAAVVDYFVAESEDDCIAAADRMVRAGSAVIIAIGDDAAFAAKNRTQDIPIIVAGVDELDEKGFVKTNQSPGKNITGVSTKMKESVQVELINKLFPKAAKVLVMYSANVESRIAVNEFSTACYGKGIKVVYEQIANADDIRKTLIENMDETTGKNVDAVYCPMDDIIFSNMADAAGVCNDNKIPFFCNSPDMVTYGGLATAVAKNKSMGIMAAGMAVKAIETPSAVAAMPVTFISLEDCRVVFNETTAKIVEFKIPEEYKNQQ